MKGLLLLGICTIAWVAWLLATMLQKKARGDAGGTSILPAIPFGPLIFWGIGLALNKLCADLGLYLVGGAHLLLFLVFIGSSVLSALKIKRM